MPKRRESNGKCGLLDRIGILEIRGERAEEERKPGPGRLELEQLRRTRNAVIPSSPELSRLEEELKRVNRMMWELQDRIEECETRKCFDARYVQRILSVEQANERRAALKNSINRLLAGLLSVSDANKSSQLELA